MVTGHNYHYQVDHFHHSSILRKILLYVSWNVTPSLNEFSTSLDILPPNQPVEKLLLSIAFFVFHKWWGLTLSKPYAYLGPKGWSYTPSAKG